MKRITAAILVVLILLCAFSACKKADEKNSGKSGMKTLDDLRSSSTIDEDDLNARRDEAAKQSGNKLNEKIKEAENNKKKNKDKDKDGSGKDGSKDNSDHSSEGKEAAESTASKLANSDYVSALSQEELKTTIKLAITYIKKRYDKNFDTKSLVPADDKCNEYNKYVIYSVGNIIIYEGEVKGEKMYIAVGRYSKDSDWRVLNKK